LPLATIATSIARLSWQEWLVWILLNSLIIYVGTLRWSVLINMLKASVSFGRLLCIRQAGQAISFITPGPQFGGEPLQLFWLCRRGMPLQKALLSLGLDRVFEVWVNFSMLLLGVSVILISPKSALVANYQMFVGVAALLVLVTAIPWLLVRQPRWLSSRFERKRWAEHPLLLKIKRHWQSSISDVRLALKTQKPKLVFALVLSLACWAALIGELLLLLRFVDASLDLTEFAMLLVAMRLALLLPIPGGIGTLEASVFWSFQLLNLPSDAALGLIALMRLRDAVILLAGLSCARLVGVRRNQQLMPN
jgi:uncharacterized protein (TIRG00374 family)